MERNIIHLDLDAFFVAVECRRDSSLIGKPVLIGGSRRRGVVAACSYEARRYGIHSAMPMQRAIRLCPQAIVVRGDIDTYSRASHEVTQVIAGAAPLFEKASIDEFYIDASGMDRYFGAFRWAQQLRAKIIQATRLPISIGMSVNKLVSKVATGEFKPGAEVHIPAGTEADFFAPLPVERIPMIGKQMTERLNRLRIHTVGDLRNFSMPFLVNNFGKYGLSLYHKARAVDNTPVIPHHDQKSVSTECTFDHDLADSRRLKSMLIAMVEKTAFLLRKQEKLAACASVKIRYADFHTETRQVRIPYTASDHILLKVVHQLFDQAYNRRMKLRLIGVKLSDLVHGSYQIRLFDDTERDINLYQAIDVIKNRHGSDKLIRANTMDVNQRVRMHANLFKGTVDFLKPISSRGLTQPVRPNDEY